MGLIQQTFCFLDGVGARKEKQLWKQGIKEWGDFLGATETEIRGISKERKAYYDRQLRKAQEALETDDAAYFRVFGREQWRLYDWFKDETGFLDVEVDGKGMIIVVGISNYYTTTTFVRGINLEKEAVEKELRKYKIVATFNGSAFDLPKLKKEFGIGIDSDMDIDSDIEIGMPHIDLKGLCTRLNMNGGLKEVEKMLNLQRPAHLNGNPVDLWKAFHASGDKEWLDLLIAYNSEDIENLKWVMDYCYKEMERRLMGV